MHLMILVSKARCANLKDTTGAVAGVEEISISGLEAKIIKYILI